jgi:site-specific DNA-cytosine methylase
MDAKINQCMWDFMEYTARVRPQIAIFESVSSAFRQGADLMRGLRYNLEQLTQEKWDLHHVVHDAYAVGGPAIRKRYFWVVSRIPFTAEHPELDLVPLHADVIGDLEDMSLTWQKQPYGYIAPSEYVQREGFRQGSNGFVDGHMTPDVPLHKRIRDLLQGTTWNEREHMEIAVRRHDEAHGKLPDSFNPLTVEKMRENDYFMGYTQPTRWASDRPSRVVTGAGPMTIVHYRQERVLTFREVARILGYPDNWLIEPLAGKPGMSLTWGKGITVQAGRWIAGEAMKALRGEVSKPGGTPTGIEDDEYLHEVKKPKLKQAIINQ